eukprot:SAG11_NODE_2904_length_2845_cov_13.583333_3_plen_132_part_00
MAAVHAGETKTQTTATASAGGDLIEMAAISTGSELMSTAHEEKEGSAHPGDSAVVSGDFLPVFGFISLPKCGHFHWTSGSGWDSHFYGTSGTVASCMYPAAENIPLRSIDIIRCSAATYPAILQRARLFVH